MKIISEQNVEVLKLQVNTKGATDPVIQKGWKIGKDIKTDAEDVIQVFSIYFDNPRNVKFILLNHTLIKYLSWMV